MGISTCSIKGVRARGIVILLAASLAAVSTASPQQATQGQQPQDTSSVQDQPQGSGDQARKPSPDVVHPVNPYPDSPGPVLSQAAGQNGQADAAKADSKQQQSDPSKPLGTAAAPYEKTTGVTASRPAGAVIAPAKQRRAHSILIRVGVVVGAAVAVGTVVALTHASPSRP